MKKSQQPHEDGVNFLFSIANQFSGRMPDS